MHSKKILILDYSIDKSETSAVKRWMPADVEVTALYIDSEESFPDDLTEGDFTHIIHTGSSLSITEPAPFTERAVQYIQQTRDKGIWQMGICYGHQLLCLALVGKHAVRSSPTGLEAGWCEVSFDQRGVSIPGVGKNEVVWEYHYDEVIALPEGSQLLATNPHTRIQAFINRELRLLGTQFHPEFDKESGDAIYIRDREILKKHHYDVDEMIKYGPSIDTGNIFFSYFLGDKK